MQIIIKILFLAVILAVFSCRKQVSKREIIKDRVGIIEDKIALKIIRNGVNVDYFFEENKAISFTKSETLILVRSFKNEVFLGIEGVLEEKKTYSIAKFNPETQTLTKIISSLSEFSDVAFSEKYIFVSQKDQINVYNNTDFSLENTIKGLSGLSAIEISEKYIIVRDTRNLLFFSLEDISKLKQEAIKPLVKGGTYTRNGVSMTLLMDRVYHLGDLRGRGQHFESYLRGENKMISPNQLIENGKKLNRKYILYDLQTYKNGFYVGMGENGFGMLNANEPFNISYKNIEIDTFKGRKLNVNSFTFTEDKLFLINKTDNTLVIYDINYIIYREY